MRGCGILSFVAWPTSGPNVANEPSAPTPTLLSRMPDDEARRTLIAAMEARMRQSETFAWSVPALVIAGQSFLLTIGLDRQATSKEKEVAAAAGIAILLAGLHFMWKHSINFWTYEAVIDRENKALDQYPVAMNKLIESLETDPPPKGPDYAQRRRWPWRPWRWLVRNTRTMWVWTLAFLALLAIDFAILLRAAF